MRLLNTLIGKLCKLNEYAPEIDRQYGLNDFLTERNLEYQDMYEQVMIFINEPPVFHKNDWLYCVKPVKTRKCDNEDWYWYFLSQLIICE